MSNKKKQSTKVQRHYCSRCGAKRNENVMTIRGKGAFGKDSWQCKRCGDSRFKNHKKREYTNMEFQLQYKKR